MTLQEKVAQMAQIERMVDTMQTWALSSRLGIPILYATDAVHGHNNLLDATIFPHNVGIGATRDEGLAHRIGVATALEVRATGIHYTFAPCVAVCRDPRWGRCYESYGEDPEIVCGMTGIVSGLQGSPPEGHLGSKNVIACAKHFLGDGGTHKGINEGNTSCTFEELERIHMKPYLDCLAQGVCTIMASYSSWNGRPLHSDRYLLTDVLKFKLGFKGFIISDYEGIDRLTWPHGSNYRYCISASVNAGIDMVMIPHRYEKFLEDLIYLVESEVIPLSRVDDAVRRILRVKFIAGIFEQPFSDRSLIGVVRCKEHLDLAREVVRKSLVLLKNGKHPKNPFLPLDKYTRKVLVCGQHADDIGYQCGGWTISWYGSSGGTSILEGIKEAVGEETVVIYEQHPSEVTFASMIDFSFAVVVVGEVAYAERLGDRSQLHIPLGGAEMINLVASKVPTVVIVISGRPLVFESYLLDKIDALVAAWLPGTEGGGVADVIFGDYDFHGKLPVNWFKSMDQIPMNDGQQSYDPLFPLGFGLKMGLNCI
ncbi:Beta-xylosidase/alpha-L-arabinofuranosidase 2 [Apostasia shenzhenica]|uniref:Beta-xylosidase/alpha-L-arabinofuranosidase 2 n=1 Tax=Apostasia shenzhenica TaxID=1088818 RepID=A0A2I0AJY4_9ASPA|nr:Beta-xylosidase/alpha-L-arabinofuranosidase 2 [Apostasia shenzhenica]